MDFENGSVPRCLVQFIEVQAQRDGYWYDPRRYQEALPAFADELPPGARVWAADAEHYDFSSVRCVKDLALASLSVRPSLVLRLSPNQSKHERGLEVRYESVRTFKFESEQLADAPAPTVQLDEVLPHEHGCQHEVAFHGGRLTVIAADLVATWVEVTA